MHLQFIKATLWAAAAFTILGAYIFAFPQSPIGNHYELPDQVPALYAAITGYMLFLFSAMYAWLALQPTIYRPMLYLGVLGKGGAFCVAVALWLSGLVGHSVVLMLSSDGIFATIWLVWLLRSQGNVASTT